MMYLIWSNKRGGMWWGANRQGYTRDLAMAGRYTRREAMQIVNKSNYTTEPGEDPNSVMVVAPSEDEWYQARASEARGRKVGGNV